MGVALITDLSGLIGSEAARHFAAKGMDESALGESLTSPVSGWSAVTTAEPEHLSTIG